jgi:hypothetical protein
MAIMQEDPGAYPTLDDHPTLALGHSVDAQQETRDPLPVVTACQWRAITADLVPPSAGLDCSKPLGAVS